MLPILISDSTGSTIAIPASQSRLQITLRITGDDVWVNFNAHALAGDSGSVYIQAGDSMRFGGERASANVFMVTATDGSAVAYAVRGHTNMELIPGNLRENGRIPIVGYPNPALFATPLPHISDKFGDDLNQDGNFSGDPTLLYDENAGTPSEYNATNVVGDNFNFNYTGDKFQGTRCINAESTVNGDTMQLTNGSSPTCTAETIHIKLTSAWNSRASNSIKLFSWDPGTGLMQGNEVPLENYFDTAEVNKWLRLAVPLSDMGITGAQSKAYRIRTENIGGASLSPNYLLDLIQLQEAGGGLEFDTLNAQPPNSIYYADVLKFSYVGALDSTPPVNGVLPDFDPTRFFHLPALANGVTQIIRTQGITSAANTFKDLITAGKIASAKTVFNSTFTIDSTVYSWIDQVIKFVDPVVFDSRLGDFSRVIVQDDLSVGNGFLKFHAYWDGSWELIS